MESVKKHLIQTPAIALIAVLLAFLAGCETAQTQEPVTPFFVPTSAIAQPAGPRQLAAINPNQVLPSSEAASFYAPRFEPYAYGSTMLGGISAFTDYTYDAQPISTLNGSGWRYRYVVKQGYSSP